MARVTRDAGVTPPDSVQVEAVTETAASMMLFEFDLAPIGTREIVLALNERLGC